MTDIPQEPSGPNRLPPLPGEPDPDAVFARCLRAARQAAGLTQKQLADHMAGRGYQMRQGTISTIEAGDRPVWLGEAVALAEAVGASLADLLTLPPVPGELNEAIAARAGWRRRLTQAQHEAAEAAAHLAQVRDETDLAARALAEAEARIRSLTRRKGEPAL